MYVAVARKYHRRSDSAISAREVSTSSSGRDREESILNNGAFWRNSRKHILENINIESSFITNYQLVTNCRL